MLNLPGILKKTLLLEIPLRLKDRSWGFKAGLLLACLHFTFVLSNTIFMIEHNEGRWHMYWIILSYADFPASLLLTQIILPIFLPNGPLYDPYMSTNASVLMLFSSFYIVLGTSWYFLLPILLEKASRKIMTNNQTAAAAVTIMIIPIFAHWLQLLRFAPRKVYYFTPGLNSILPAVWIALLFWLFLATKYKKAVLWLLLFAPSVFYYFIHDLYYYMMFKSH